MIESYKKTIKYILFFSLPLFFIISNKLQDKSIADQISYTVSISLFAYELYIKFFWKWNPLEKTPKISGYYEMTFISTYSDSHPALMNVEIKQDLLSTRVYVTTEESSSKTITSDIIKDADFYELIYTFENIPSAKNKSKSCIHFGTCRFKIRNNIILSGEYYTSRKTTGDIINIKKIKKSHKDSSMNLTKKVD